MNHLSTIVCSSTYLTIFFVYLTANIAFGKTYIYTEDANIPTDHFEYLEGANEKASISDLEKADWKHEIGDVHSYYNGFWVKLTVLNKSGITNLGIRHWTTFEKKLFAVNSSGIQEYDYISFYDNSYSFMGIDRIQFRYRVLMPIDEVTEIYSYYKFQPLHRTLSTRHEIFGISTWEDLQFQSLFQIMRIVFFFAILIYLLVNSIASFWVTRDSNYFWLTFLLFSMVFAAIYLSGFTIGFRGNPHIGQLIFSIILIAITQFFKNFLNFTSKYIKNIANSLIFLHFLIIFYYAVRSFEFPDGEYFTDLEKFPIQPFGIGYFKIIIQFLPTILVFFYFVFLSFKAWRSGDKASGYIVLAITLPVISFATIAMFVYLGQKAYIELEMITLVGLPISGIILVLCPISINLALEEKIKAFKDDALTKLESLNAELDDKVRERTLDLQKANNLITDSIQSASAIQSAILPNIKINKYGFGELAYIWEPRDIVGGDFYWVQQQKDWTALVVADCTGHGIPGAFMTLISSTILDRIASLNNLSQPDRLLDQLDKLLSQTFKLNKGDSTSFGLDCGVCCFSKKEGILRFAGARSNLYQKVGENVNEMKGDKVSLGYDFKEHPISFKVVETILDKNSSFYMFSDGITDQIGGKKKLMYGRKRLLHQIQSSASVTEAIEKIMKDLANYQSDHKRRDDLTLFGFSF